MYHEHYLAVEDINISSNHFTVTSLHSMFQQLSCALTMLLWIGHPPILPMNQIPLLKFEDGEDRRRGEAKEGGGGETYHGEEVDPPDEECIGISKTWPNIQEANPTYWIILPYLKLNHFIN
jgi:hypothetical protein